MAGRLEKMSGPLGSIDSEVRMVIRDELSAALDLVRMRTAIFCRGELHAPWAFHVPTKRGATFHIALDAPVWILRDDGPALRLEAGDFALFPNGIPHVIADAPSSQPVRLQTVLPFEVPTLGTRTFTWDGAGARTTLLTGVFRFDPSEARLLAALPDVLHVRAGNTPEHSWLPIILDFLASEAGSEGAGKQMILSRLGDILFVQAVRASLGSATIAPGWLAALRDDQMSTALGLMHRFPERAWTVDALAAESAMSRAAFARRFRDAVGTPPLEYLTTRRMENAARALRESTLAIQEIAARSGYQSEMALTKAFKRSFGISPAAYRRDSRSVSRRAPHAS